MKKILTILAISFSALMANSVTTAAPHDNDRDWDQPRHQSEIKVATFVTMMTTMTVCKINVGCAKNVA